MAPADDQRKAYYTVGKFTDMLALTGVNSHVANARIIVQLLSTNATLVCVLSDIKSAVILSGYRYLGDSDTDLLEILHDGRYGSRTQILPGDPNGP